MYEPKGAIHTEQTGKFPHRSIRGKRYQMILHEIDGNSNRIEPMKNKTEGEMILARSCTLERMKAQGILLTHHVLDNEISTMYRLEIKKTCITYQLVPPDDPHHKLAEKLIQTRKEHFIGVIIRISESFSDHLWCQSIHQVEQ